MKCCTRFFFSVLCEGFRVELSEVEFLDLLQTNHCESIFQRLLSLIKNESWRGSLRNGHHVTGRQQARKVKCVRISPATHRDLESFQ